MSRIMLHKLEIASQFTCFASTPCNANSTIALDPSSGSAIRSHFSTPDVSVKH